MDFFTDLAQTIRETSQKDGDPDRFPWGPMWEIHQLRLYTEGICSLCMLANPTVALDIGTGYGISCLALAYALRILDLPLDILTTLGLGMSYWRRMPYAIGGLLDRWKLSIDSIRTVEANFLDVDSRDFFSRDDRVMIFYDIHDDPQNDRYMAKKFLAEWVPRIKEGLVAVHDMGRVKPGYQPSAKSLARYSHSHAMHWAGQRFAGFGEAVVFIDWLNEHYGQLMVVPHTSIVYFRIENGEPL